MSNIDTFLLCNKTKTVRTLTFVPRLSSLYKRRYKIYRTDYKCKPICEIVHTVHFYEGRFQRKCTRCYNNSVKNKIGNEPCNPCARGWVANMNKTTKQFVMTHTKTYGYSLLTIRA